MRESQRVKIGVTVYPEFAKSEAVSLGDLSSPGLTSPSTAFCVLNHSLDCYCSASELLKQKIRDTVTEHVRKTDANERYGSLSYAEADGTVKTVLVRTGVTVKPAPHPHALNLSHPPGSTVCPGCGFEYAGQPFCPNCGYKVTR